MVSSGGYTHTPVVPKLHSASACVSCCPQLMHLLSFLGLGSVSRISPFGSISAAEEALTLSLIIGCTLPCLVPVELVRWSSFWFFPAWVLSSIPLYSRFRSQYFSACCIASFHHGFLFSSICCLVSFSRSCGCACLSVIV